MGLGQDMERKTISNRRENPRRNANKRKTNQSKFKFQPYLKTLARVKDIGGFPDEYHTTLRYSVAGTLLGNGSNTAFSVSYYINAPGSLSHLPKGYAPLASVYNQYFVKAVTYRYTVTNLSSTLPVKLYLLLANPDTSATLSSNIVNLAETEGTITRQLGISSSGQSVAIINAPRARIASLAGLEKDVSQANEDYCGYTGSTNSTVAYTRPVQSYQLSAAIFSLNGSNIALNSVSATLELDMEIVFFSRLPVY